MNYDDDDHAEQPLPADFKFTINHTIPLPTMEVAVGPCEEFQGARQPDGYGTKKIAGKWYRAHRAAWENAYGPIPPGLYVLHLCNNPPCFRLSHLKLGTHADNMLHMTISGRGRGGSHGGKRISEAIAANIRSWTGSQRAAARALGVDRQTVRRYIKGFNSPSSSACSGGGV